MTIEEELKTSNFENEQVKANLNILVTASFLHNKMSARMKKFGVSNEQVNVLRILRGKHPESLCQKNILERMIDKSSNLTMIIGKLKSKSLIKLSRSTVDKREYVINITKDGIKLLTAIDDDFNINNIQKNGLSASEAFHLNYLLDKLRNI